MKTMSPNTTTADLLQQLAQLSPEQRFKVLEKLRAQGVELSLAGSPAGAPKLPTASVVEDRHATPIPPVDRSKPLPLSFQQEQLWFLQQLDPTNVAYNEREALLLEGTLDLAQLEEAIQTVVRRHESLRTTFANEIGMDDQIDGASDNLERKSGRKGAVQIVHPFDATTYRLTQQIVPTLDDATLADLKHNRNTELAHLIAGYTQQPFDLHAAPLWRIVLFSTETTADAETVTKTGNKVVTGRHILLLVIHHIIADAWSNAILLTEIASTYMTLSQGQPAVLPELPVTYADFSGWQRTVLQGERMARHLDYWHQSLAGAPPFLPLPTDYPRPAVPSGRGNVYPIRLDRELTQRLQALSRKAGATLYMTLLSAFNVLLARYTGQDDIVIGSVQANRAYLELEPVIGHFVNTVAIRTQLPDHCSFYQLLAQMKEQIQASYDHQELPFQLLVQTLKPERTLGYHPLYQVSFNLHNQPGIHVEEFAGCTALPLTLGKSTSKVDLYLHLSVDEKRGELIGEFEYNTDILAPTTIARMVEHFKILLDGVVSHPEQPVHQLPMLTEAEYHQIVHEWNDTVVDFGPPQTIHALFEQQVERAPHAVALVFEDKQLTYGELNKRANQLAHHLINLGVGPDTLVAVAMERSVEMVVSLLAVLKAGGAYVPIDPSYPQERIRFMLEDSEAHILLTQSHLSLGIEVQFVLTIDEMETGIAAFCPENPQTQTLPAHLAYVIYTSGSTGQPKAAMLTHHGLCNVTMSQIDSYHVQPSSKILQAVSFSFDVATANTFMTLCAGATLVLPAPQTLLIGETLSQQIDYFSITHLQVPVSILTSMPHKELPSLHTIIVGGESVPLDLIRYWSTGRNLFNAYGPTEATICATVMNCQGEILQSVSPPIGAPLSNVHVFVLDQNLYLNPVGVAGELYIGGVQLARGYLNRPELTAERFIEHPAFGRLYKTGDLCRWLPDGNLEYIGRTDFQVKIRGFRIELGEIESALLAQPGVREAVVLAREENGDKRLVAYLVGDVNAEPLRQALATQLPDYMVPAAFVPLDAMPLTSNGKLDRRALPAPDYRESGSEFVAPRSEVERQIAAIWAEVLRVEGVGVYDNFFALGGHSLLATQVVSRVRSQLMREVPLRTLFEASQLGAFAAAVGGRRRTRATPSSLWRGTGRCPSPLPSSGSGSSTNWSREAPSTTSPRPSGWRVHSR